jgi:phosphonopyruvate decarboxylase
MISPGFFCGELKRRGTEFFTGVPDSLLKSFCAWVTDHAGEANHLIAVNEGAAAALAAGHHLSGGGTPLVYMQNSGIGNAVNPLLSLADGDVYRIPMILLIGWRGEPCSETSSTPSSEASSTPGAHDEPQHLKQGKVTCALFDAMGIPYRILADSENEVCAQLDECYAYIQREGAPFALIVRKETFAPYTLRHPVHSPGDGSAEMSREAAIEAVMLAAAPGEVFISTTGMASRELYELREKHGMGHERDFLTVGSMGHASSLALAIALQKPGLSVNCIDGDGAVLMHLGAVAAIGVRGPENLRHIVLNNGAHDSVGGQPTMARTIDLCGIARAAGYRRVYCAKNAEELRAILAETAVTENSRRDGPLFIEVWVRKGSRADLGRPKSTPQENKEVFMRFIQGAVK